MKDIVVFYGVKIEPFSEEYNYLLQAYCDENNILIPDLVFQVFGLESYFDYTNFKFCYIGTTLKIIPNREDFEPVSLSGEVLYDIKIATTNEKILSNEFLITSNIELSTHIFPYEVSTWNSY